MSAPLPLRLSNPLKKLAEKYSMDYETLLGHMSEEGRKAYILASIPKKPEDFKAEDRKAVKHKIEFIDKKYGTIGQSTKTNDGESKTQDKGAERYNQRLGVSSLGFFNREDYSPEALRDMSKIVVTKSIGDVVWRPGQGIIKLGGPAPPGTV
jgi:hypothetical protein